MKQTAVEWLMEEITYDNGFGERRNSYIDSFDLLEFFEQAKELEKQQIVIAFINGDNSDCTQEQDALLYALEYYNKTFTKPTRIANDNINVTNK